MKNIEFNIEERNVEVSNDIGTFKRLSKKSKASSMDNIQHVINKYMPANSDWTSFEYAKKHILCYSEARQLCFKFNTYKDNDDNSNDSIVKKLSDIFGIVSYIDDEILKEPSSKLTPTTYIFRFKKQYEEFKNEEYYSKLREEKRKTKSKAKQLVKERFKINEILTLKRTNHLDSEYLNNVYQVVKFVYSIGNNIVNSLVLKQIKGKTAFHRKQLSVKDCKSLHIKYEPGLFIFSMNTPFYKLTEKSLEDFKNNNNEQEEIH